MLKRIVITGKSSVIQARSLSLVNGREIRQDDPLQNETSNRRRDGAWHLNRQLHRIIISCNDELA